MPITSQVVHHYYIHNVIGSFVRTMAAFLSNDLYKPTTEVVIGTYEKALQHYKSLQEEGDSKRSPGHPFMSFDPSLEIEPEDRAGRFPYQYPNLARNQGAKQWDPKIYEDDNVTIAPVLNRYKGMFEVVLWCRSVYEYLDFKVLTHQFFGGPDRTIYPVNVSGYMAIPDCLRYYTHDNPYQLNTYQLDWTNNKAESVLYKTLNRDKFVFPFDLRPEIKLTSASDASEKYGGDGLAEYKLQITLEWESWLPTHMVLVDHVYPKDKYVCNVDVGAYYLGSDYTIKAPTDVLQTLVDPDTHEVSKRELYAKTRMAYVMTAADIAAMGADTRVQITLPEATHDSNTVKVFHPEHVLRIGYDFQVLEDMITLELIPTHLKDIMSEDDIVTIVLYNETDELQSI